MPFICGFAGKVMTNEEDGAIARVERIVNDLKSMMEDFERETRDRFTELEGEQRLTKDRVVVIEVEQKSAGRSRDALLLDMNSVKEGIEAIRKLLIQTMVTMVTSMAGIIISLTVYIFYNVISR